MQKYQWLLDINTRLQKEKKIKQKLNKKRKITRQKNKANEPVEFVAEPPQNQNPFNKL